MTEVEKRLIVKRLNEKGKRAANRAAVSLNQAIQSFITALLAQYLADKGWGSGCWCLSEMLKKRVQKGSLFLCTDQYCTRYMVGTRGKGEVNSATNHIGFRCVLAPWGSAEHAAAPAAQCTN